MIASIAWFAAAMLLVGAAPAQDTPRELNDLVGARAGQAEGEVQRRGYRNVRGEKGDDRSYTYWWNDARRQCVTIATMDGRYSSIVTTPAPDCRQADRPDRRNDRPRRDAPRAPGHTANDLPGICKGQAAISFDRRPSEITINQPIRQPRGSIVQGWFDRDKRTRFFTCRFDADDRFLGVM